MGDPGGGEYEFNRGVDAPGRKGRAFPGRIGRASVPVSRERPLGVIMALHIDSTTYPGYMPDEYAILNAYRATVQAGIGREGSVFRVDGLSVSTIRMVMRDRWPTGTGPARTAWTAAEAEYLRACVALSDKPTLRTMHT